MRRYKAEPALPSTRPRKRAMVTEWRGDQRTAVILHDVKPSIAEIIAELLNEAHKTGKSDQKLIDMYGAAETELNEASLAEEAQFVEAVESVANGSEK